MAKNTLNINVYEASIERIEWVFRTFDNVNISFSGGKDSSVLFHLVASIARKEGKKFSVLFIDWEVQYKITINHVIHMKDLYTDVIQMFYWVALPLTTVNGVSQINPEWICWQQGKEWVRQPPKYAITEYNYFPFYHYGMTFEEFVPAFSLWLAGSQVLASLTGMRADESLNRFRAVNSKYKSRYTEDRPWTTSYCDGRYYVCYPLYDWKFNDIWVFNSRNKCSYNYIYELMYKAGVPWKYMRICEPFGPESRRSLKLYHVLEPETWGKMCDRVSGACCGAIYANKNNEFYALREKISKPSGYTWQSYAMFLLSSMPVKTAEHYKNKICIYLHWYQERGWPNNIPDEQDGDLGSRDIPSWRRICKMLIKNDYWCRMLSFSPTKKDCYNKYFQRIKEKRKKWSIEI